MNPQLLPKSVYPRWRGELALLALYSAPCPRFIPAGAGNSCDALPGFIQHCGLSPLARGTH
ncbi:hypothetical protein HPP98_002423 [Escherichia coli]|nr:hypothetical protein [Escherichia coli]